MQPHSRRDFLHGVGLTLAAVSFTAACNGRSGETTAAELLAASRFYIAHRGSGEEAPEHTLSAYRTMVERGCQAVEISVRRTRDGVLVCHHDETLARTCDGAPGSIAELTEAELRATPVDMRWLVGPGWAPEPIPRLDDVLERIGGRAVLFIEPKDRAVAQAVLDLITQRSLQQTVVYKQHYLAGGEDAAREHGLQVWNYLDDDADPAAVPAAAARSDALGAQVDAEPVSPQQTAVLSAAVATGKPVIGWAVHRRGQVEQLEALGVRGFMSSAWTYLAQPPARARRDGFASGRVQPGDLSARVGPQDAPTWNSDGSLGLASLSGRQAISMGSMCPLPDRYTLSVQMAFDAVPGPDQHAGLVINRPDDSPYLFRTPGASGGHLVVLRADGRLELREVPKDNGQSTPVTSVSGEPVRPGRWETVAITVSPGSVLIRREPEDGSPRTIAAEASLEGRYFSLTRNYAGTMGAVRFRDISVLDA